ncbi:VQ motif containing protein [Trema orientale]|uniref:VQ motif containing protein n=1 Tax=Trema orientale TaxID=63057 RepID=A0A2P5CK28_TREOI|nr:VQ motif containing protein [Trema orientale]
METSPRHQLNHNPCSLLPSPNSHSTTSTTSSTNSNGVQPSPTPPLTPKPITRSESANPYPTTFVQADTSSFKQVVQMLTGSSETAKQASSSSSAAAAAAADPSPRTGHNHIPPVKSMPKKQQSGFKLYERRNSIKNLRINPMIPAYASGNNSGFSPRKPEILSPSILDFPSLVLSPVTPLIPDPFDRSGSAGFACSRSGKASLDAEAEEKAIKEKGFYLHPSPATTPRDPEPRLLPLFPTTSPRASGSLSS